jgi:EAL domain-containing protein (putative c-di-GMP-specific phosphodiesterase class I)
MNNTPNPLAARAKAIQGKVDLLEKLHKACQLSTLGLLEPILNEARYLSRALSDVLYFYGDDDAETERHLFTAELAVHSGINDAVDTLVTHVKTSISRVMQDYPNFQIPVSAYGDEYLTALKAIQEVDKIVVYSRGNRRDRVKIYQTLAEPEKEAILKVISDFALKVAEIEAVAQQSNAPPPKPDSVSDEVLAQHMRAALKGNDPSTHFHVYLQPKYERREIGGDVCIGAEALLRLQVDDHFIPPVHFIGVAERSRIISPIGLMVMKKALEILRTYPDFPCISVNISPIELLSPNYCAEVQDLIAGVGIDPKRLELEITERVVMNDGLAYQHIRELANFGIKISIDDFGTGETRFDYLAKFNVDVIKIEYVIGARVLRLARHL